MSDEPETIRVQLARMEGKLDLSNLRHAQHDARFVLVESRLSSHGDRIGGLENREFGRDGERKGLTAAAKWLWAVVGVLAGGVAALFKAVFGQ